MQTPPGITEGNQSYYTGNSFSVPHSVLQSLHGTPVNSEQLPAFIQEVNAPTSSGFTSSPLLSCSAVSSQATVAPTRNGTGGVIPLAEAITQISFLEFLQRFGVSIAPPQPPQSPVSNSHLEAAVQTTTPCNVSQDVSTQTSDHSDTLSCDVAVQLSFFLPLPYHWMLLRRRSHLALCLSMSLRRWVLAQLPRFLLMRLCRILHIVLY